MLRGEAFRGVTHGAGRSSGRSNSAGSQATDAWASARSGPVCRRGCCAAHSWPRAQAASRGRGVSDQRRSVCLRLGDTRADRRVSGRGHPPAGDDGRDLRLGRPDAVDGGSARCRPPRNLRIGDRGRRVRPGCRSLHGSAFAAFPAGGDRHDHPGNRHLAHARRHQLGRRRLADLDQGRRRGGGSVSQSQLRSA